MPDRPPTSPVSGAGGRAGGLSLLPQVDALLHHPDADDPVRVHGRQAVTDAIRATLDEIRAAVRAGSEVPAPEEVVARATARLVRQRSARLRPVLNATGVILHTNLGRAPLSPAAIEAVTRAAGYTNVEYDLANGNRGSRTAHVGALAAEACGTEAATVVNNGAAALVLVLAALSTGREAVISRGELIEIGGSYRLPDVMQVSGAIMREVGTTNRTRAGDYRDAISDRTGLLLKVHPSNYAVIGFAETATASELAAMASEHDLPFVYDLGSGLLGDAPEPLGREPSVAAAIREGADLVVFSGDKLLGGPQAGIIAGRADLVDRCRRHPLARAVRIDKLQRAALEATLEAHLRAPGAPDLPTWNMLHTDPAELERRARALADALGPAAEVVASASLVGGGSLPGVELGSWSVVVAVGDVEQLGAELRRAEPAVVGRVEEGRLVLDLRTVPSDQDRILTDLVGRALATLARDRP